ncbi:adenylate isopentenyltransferase 5, chloroplastic-like [Sesamum indicum]|uniref:Adenylate isopentenyltransferase 5, chloroplastic-like n=1 Tax=Sesamum indicum TaxID=4182 RepID=A0A6I9V225_SESIN|nr:adenylate isopentenyltransferase 5, chloroplastic-like [Sesamum indicum]
MSISSWKPTQSNMTNFSVWSMMNKHQGKDKVVVILGATGTGKSRMVIDLATRFRIEVINSDKIEDFVHHALLAVDAIVQKNRLAINAGGSNSFVQALVNDNLSFTPSTSVAFSGWTW